MCACGNRMTGERYTEAVSGEGNDLSSSQHGDAGTPKPEEA